MAKTSPFTFTITDLARFLGKSPATIRQWERNNLVQVPRENGKRHLQADDVMLVANIAHANRRISEQRLRLVHATVTLINMIEGENDT